MSSAKTKMLGSFLSATQASLASVPTTKDARTRQALLRQGLADGRCYAKVSGKNSDLLLASVETRLAGVDKEVAVIEKEEARLAAIAEQQRKVKEAQEEARRRAEEAAAAAKEAREKAAHAAVGRGGGGRLRCCDDTLSPSCFCAGKHRGCCSHHGGVCGCE